MIEYLQREMVRIELNYIGEGLCGDYDKGDPDDEKMLRFYVQHYTDGEWLDVEDASYCTATADNASDELRLAFMKKIMNSVYNRVIAGDSVKHVCAELSWTNEKDLAADIVD